MVRFKIKFEATQLRNVCFTVLLTSLVGLASIAAVADNAPATNASLTGDAIYQKQCAKCHGKSAEGRHFGGPSLVSDHATAMSADDLRNVITNGKGRMPKYASKTFRRRHQSLDSGDQGLH